MDVSLRGRCQDCDLFFELRLRRELAEEELAISAHLCEGGQCRSGQCLYRRSAQAEATEHVSNESRQPKQGLLDGAYLVARAQREVQQGVALRHAPLGVGEQSSINPLVGALDEAVDEGHGVHERRVAALAAGPARGVGRVAQQHGPCRVVCVAPDRRRSGRFLAQKLLARVQIHNVGDQWERLCQCIAHRFGIRQIAQTHRRGLALLRFRPAGSSRRGVAPGDERADASGRRFQENRVAARTWDGVHGVEIQSLRHLREANHLQVAGQWLLCDREALARLLHGLSHDGIDAIATCHQACRCELSPTAAPGVLDDNNAGARVHGLHADLEGDLEPASRRVPCLQLRQEGAAEIRLVDEEAGLQTLAIIGRAQLDFQGGRGMQLEPLAPEAAGLDGLPEGVVHRADGAAASDAEAQRVGAALPPVQVPRVGPALQQLHARARVQQLVREQEARGACADDHDLQVRQGLGR
mmetsp:Transcript_68689/g.223613  ORF Transcript_68689/g.223613 Transcript_68689/m.223613 type:complete len:469 (+) Transcript_68689:77-1483(+)